AGQDYRGTFVNLCLPAGAPAGGRGTAPAARGAAGRGAAAAAPAAAPQTPDRANWYAPPFKIFDNLYWLGTRQHSTWALQTSAGIILIDTNFAWATQPEIIDGMTKLGLKPEDIKYVIISHAHGDHDQGAAYLQERYSAKAAADAKASVIISNHSEYDGAYTKARLIAAPRQVGEEHPFIVGAAGVQRYFTVMSECATASKLRNGAK